MHALDDTFCTSWPAISAGGAAVAERLSHSQEGLVEQRSDLSRHPAILQRLAHAEHPFVPFLRPDCIGPMRGHDAVMARALEIERRAAKPALPSRNENPNSVLYPYSAWQRGATDVIQAAVVPGGASACGDSGASPSGAGAGAATDGSTAAPTGAAFGSGATRLGRGFAGALRLTVFFAAAFLTALVLATGRLARRADFARGFAALRLATLLPRPALLFFTVDPRIVRAVSLSPYVRGPARPRRQPFLFFSRSWFAAMNARMSSARSSSVSHCSWYSVTGSLPDHRPTARPYSPTFRLIPGSLPLRSASFSRCRRSISALSSASGMAPRSPRPAAGPRRFARVQRAGYCSWLTRRNSGNRALGRTGPASDPPPTEDFYEFAHCIPRETVSRRPCIDDRRLRSAWRLAARGR